MIKRVPPAEAGAVAATAEAATMQRINSKIHMCNLSSQSDGRVFHGDKRGDKGRANTMEGVSEGEGRANQRGKGIVWGKG